MVMMLMTMMMMMMLMVMMEVVLMVAVVEVVMVMVHGKDRRNLRLSFGTVSGTNIFLGQGDLRRPVSCLSHSLTRLGPS